MSDRDRELFVAEDIGRGNFIQIVHDTKCDDAYLIRIYYGPDDSYKEVRLEHPAFRKLVLAILAEYLSREP